MKKCPVWVCTITFFILILLLETHSFAQNALEVEGIISGDALMAVVNGKVVKVGDKIEDTEVVEIGEDFVKFSSEQGGNYILRLEGRSQEVELSCNNDVVGGTIRMGVHDEINITSHSCNSSGKVNTIEGEASDIVAISNLITDLMVNICSDAELQSIQKIHKQNKDLVRFIVDCQNQSSKRTDIDIWKEKHANLLNFLRKYGIEAVKIYDGGNGLSIIWKDEGLPVSKRLEQKLNYCYHNFDSISLDTIGAILEGRVLLGMTRNDVRMSIGSPSDINRSEYPHSVHEQWVYGSRYRSYVYFEDGKVTAVQD